jgi:3',5'-cyclic AMP phosphodiesterase CpdA
MDDLTPFLQIIHISDLHVTDPTTPSAVSARILIRRLRKVLPEKLVNQIDDGVQPHDPLAVTLFKEFITRISSQDREWSQCTTWLVDTGDLTGLGDADSLDLGLKYWSDFVQLSSGSASIYGNHDAWPGAFPLFANFTNLVNQPQALISRNFTVATPNLSLRAPIPHGQGEVQLYFIDSIRHDRIGNTMALGEVPVHQLNGLTQLVDQHHSPGQYNFRILAVHHPVHFPPPRRRTYMSLSNDSHVAQVLDQPTPNRAHPLAHMVLSGHTHALFPEHGKLPLQPSLCKHPDLGADQCQLVIGSLMQLDRYNKRGDCPHQCEVLRLYYSKSDPSVLSVERLLAARRSGNQYPGTGTGPYECVPLKNKNKLDEEITFSLH